MKSLILAGLLLFSSDYTPPIPYHARRIKPPVAYQVIWGQVERCVGRQASFHRTEWYIVPDRVILMLRGSEKIAIAENMGEWNDWRPRIYIKAEYANHMGVVRHEIVHIVLGPGVRGHPMPPFGVCAALYLEDM